MAMRQFIKYIQFLLSIGEKIKTLSELVTIVSNGKKKGKCLSHLEIESIGPGIYCGTR